MPLSSCLHSYSPLSLLADCGDDCNGDDDSDSDGDASGSDSSVGEDDCDGCSDDDLSPGLVKFIVTVCINGIKRA